uniref:Uncharacterized protein n=1 Tax=Cacopsylla melanoneura TaxID=428564 RepID=A0A8D9A6R1_9HEMI
MGILSLVLVSLERFDPGMRTLENKLTSYIEPKKIKPPRAAENIASEMKVPSRLQKTDIKIIKRKQNYSQIFSLLSVRSLLEIVILAVRIINLTKRVVLILETR